MPGAHRTADPPNQSHTSDRTSRTGAGATRRPPVPTIASLPLDSIDIEAQLIRDSMDEEALHELAEDIRARGLLQPIGVRALPNARYQLLFGSRRLRAHVLNKATHIVAHVYKGDGPVKGIALAENLHRAQLTLREEIMTVLELHNDHQLSPEQIAAATGKSRDWVLRRLAVPQFSPDLRQPLLEGTLGLGAAEEIERIKDPPTRSWTLAQALAGRISTADIRATRRACDDAIATGDITESAIQAGVEVHRTYAPTYHCEACGQTRPHEALRVVRICATGCPTTKADNSPTH